MTTTTETKRDASLTTTATNQTLNPGKETTDVQETWADVLLIGTPEPQLITREHLLQELHDATVDVSERILLSWEAKGVLPRPVRRWRDGAPRAFYPVWWGDIIREVRELRDSGVSLEQIRPRVRFLLFDRSRIHSTYAHARGAALTAALQYAHVHEEFSGRPVSRVELRLLDADGNASTACDVPVTPGSTR
jgi:hypothetical protein